MIMPSLFSEQTVGLLLQRHRVTAVELHAGFSLGRPVYNVVRRSCRILPENWRQHDQWLEILDDFPASVPIIPVVQFPVVSKVPGDPSSAAEAEIFKPLIRTGGSVWQSRDGLTGAVDGSTGHAVETLLRSGRRVPGMVHPVHAVYHLLSDIRRGTGNSITVISDPPRYTVIMVAGNPSNSICRTFQMPADAAGDTLRKFINTHAAPRPERMTTPVTWFGPAPVSAITDTLDRHTPVVPWTPSPSRFTVADGPESNGEAGSWGIAAGAVICWMNAFQPPLMMDSAGPPEKNRPLYRHSRTLLKTAVLILLLSFNGWAGSGLIQRRMQITNLQHIESTRTDIQAAGDPVPELLRRPAAGIRYRNHRYLDALTTFSRDAGIALDEVDIRMERIRIRGHSDRMEPIGAFARAVRDLFARPGTGQPDVGSPVTSRDSENRLAFNLDIDWTP